MYKVFVQSFCNKVRNEYCILQYDIAKVKKKKEHENLKIFYNKNDDKADVKVSGEWCEVEFFYDPVDIQWQIEKCYVGSILWRAITCITIGHKLPVSRPHGVKKFVGDRNCWFRAVSYVITGSKGYHMD